MKQDGAERILTTASAGVVLRRPTLPSSRGEARAETMESPRSHPAASAATVDRKLARQLVLDPADADRSDAGEGERHRGGACMNENDVGAGKHLWTFLTRSLTMTACGQR